MALRVSPGTVSNVNFGEIGEDEGLRIVRRLIFKAVRELLVKRMGYLPRELDCGCDLETLTRCRVLIRKGEKTRRVRW